MNLTVRNNRFEAISSFHEKDIPKAAGFRWDVDKKVWWTDNLVFASSLREYADSAAAERLSSLDGIIAESRSADVPDIDIPCPDGLSYFPYQAAGVNFSIKRDSVLIGDEMGLGKTIQAIGVINCTRPESVLIICPATLKLNWEKELRKWLTVDMDITVVNAKQEPPTTGAVIINYDIAGKLSEWLHSKEWDLLIADEAHYMKNKKAKRTAAVLGDGKGGGIKARRKVFLTGTPVTNRPLELFPIMSYLFPKSFDNYWQFAKRYCGAVYNGMGWDMTGASNLLELQDVLRSCGMIRRLKADVLKELPPKRRQIISLPSDSVSGLIQQESEISDKYADRIAELEMQVEMSKISDNDSEYEEAVAKLKEAQSVSFEEMARIRMELAIAKIPFVCEHVRDFIESGEKVVVMCHHRAVVDAIAEYFGKTAVKLYGGMSITEKNSSVEQFQSSPDVMVFVGSIRAAGVGITLTASSNVVFAELDWVPANMLQAEDRCHRIGQDDNVLVQQLVFDGSLDSRMANTLVRKMNIIDKVLDKSTESRDLSESLSMLKREKSPTKVSVDVISSKQHDVTDEIKEVVVRCLSELYKLCNGATSVDGMGFSKYDYKFGESLATAGFLTNKMVVAGCILCKKYKKQLPKEDIDIISGFLKIEE